MKPYKHVRDKGNPLVQRFLDAMEIVGARPDKAEISEQGNVHLIYGGKRFVIKGDQIGIGYLSGGNTIYHNAEIFNQVANWIWERGLLGEYDKILTVPVLNNKRLSLEIKARYSPEGKLDQMLIVEMNASMDTLPRRAHSTNPNHIALARGYLLGDTPAEVALEYLCEVCPQIQDFVYPTGE